LRVLQEKTFERVGGTRTLQVDIRLIVATNKSLKTEVMEGRFREDLYFRLNVVHLVLPLLQERREDIRLLVEHFIEKYHPERNAASAPIIGIDQEVERLFHDYDWPGNVRELENVIERAMVMCADTIIRLGDLPQDFKDNVNDSLSLSSIPPDAKLYDTLAQVEKEMIMRAMKRADNVQTRAAEMLGIGKSGLNQKIKKYQLDTKAAE
jgi:two-component system, NtrC family, response regulator